MSSFTGAPPPLIVQTWDGPVVVVSTREALQWVRSPKNNLLVDKKKSPFTGEWATETFDIVVFKNDTNQKELITHTKLLYGSNWPTLVYWCRDVTQMASIKPEGGIWWLNPPPPLVLLPPHVKICQREEEDAYLLRPLFKGGGGDALLKDMIANTKIPPPLPPPIFLTTLPPLFGAEGLGDDIYCCNGMCSNTKNASFTCMHCNNSYCSNQCWDEQCKRGCFFLY